MAKCELTHSFINTNGFKLELTVFLNLYNVAISFSAVVQGHSSLG